MSRQIMKPALGLPKISNRDHKLGGPLSLAFNALNLVCAPNPENGMFADFTDPTGSVPDFTMLEVAPEDAMTQLDEGGMELAVVGRNTYEEYLAANPDSVPPVVVADLGFSKCQLRAGIPQAKAAAVTRPADILALARPGEKLRIATSYPASTRDWLRENGIDEDRVRIITLKGKVEAATLRIAEMVVDIVEGGGSMGRAGLKPLFNVSAAPSSALLVRRADADAPEVMRIADRLTAACAATITQEYRRDPVALEPLEQPRLVA